MEWGGAPGWGGEETGSSWLVKNDGAMWSKNAGVQCSVPLFLSRRVFRCEVLQLRVRGVSGRPPGRARGVRRVSLRPHRPVHHRLPAGELHCEKFKQLCGSLE